MCWHANSCSYIDLEQPVGWHRSDVYMIIQRRYIVSCGEAANMSSVSLENLYNDEVFCVVERKGCA